MNLIVLGQKIPCVKAAKDETSGTVCAWNAQGSEVFSAQKVTDFSIFAVEGGEWSEPPPTPEERLNIIEAAIERGMNL